MPSNKKLIKFTLIFAIFQELLSHVHPFLDRNLANFTEGIHCKMIHRKYHENIIFILSIVTWEYRNFIIPDSNTKNFRFLLYFNDDKTVSNSVCN